MFCVLATNDDAGAKPDATYGGDTQGAGDSTSVRE